MGLFGPRQQRLFTGITGAEDLIPGRAGGGYRSAGGQVISDDRALRHSVVWACLRMRAALVSTFPIDQYRDVLGVRTEITPKPPILTDPGGTQWDMIDWLAASQVDLDRCGNTVGLIVERSAARTRYYPEGLPSRIELQPASSASYVRRPGKPDRWRIGGKWYALNEVYHERQNVVPGLPVGLSPVVYGALAVGEGLAMQQFGLDWFAKGGVPKARMRNTAKKLDPKSRQDAKDWYAQTIANGDLLVMGADWEYDMIQAETAGLEWLEGRRASGVDVCRFFDTPADLVDASPGGSSGGQIRYANMTQRNLQFLIMHLGPLVQRRERSLSRLLPMPRYVKMTTDALLRMDPQTRQKVLRSRIDSRVLTNTEARALEERPKLTAADIAEFEAIYGPPKGSAVSAEPAGDETDEEPAEAGV
jgi:HK97 family phage portal protein